MKEIIMEIDNVINELHQIVDLLYKQDKDNAYIKLNTGLISLSNLIDNIYRFNINNENYSFDVNKLTLALGEGLNAMELFDLTLLADILNYEIIELLNEAKNI